MLRSPMRSMHKYYAVTFVCTVVWLVVQCSSARGTAARDNGIDGDLTRLHERLQRRAQSKWIRTCKQHSSAQDDLDVALDHLLFVSEFSGFFPLETDECFRGREGLFPGMHVAASDSSLALFPDRRTRRRERALAERSCRADSPLLQHAFDALLSVQHQSAPGKAFQLAAACFSRRAAHASAAVLDSGAALSDSERVAWTWTWVCTHALWSVSTCPAHYMPLSILRAMAYTGGACATLQRTLALLSAEQQAQVLQLATSQRASLQPTSAAHNSAGDAQEPHIGLHAAGGAAQVYAAACGSCAVRRTCKISWCSACFGFVVGAARARALFDQHALDEPCSTQTRGEHTAEHPPAAGERPLATREYQSLHPAHSLCTLLQWMSVEVQPALWDDAHRSSDGALQSLLGAVRFRSGDFLPALDAFSRALTSAPDDVNLLSNAGAAAAKAEHYGRCAVLFARAYRTAVRLGRAGGEGARDAACKASWCRWQVGWHPRGRERLREDCLLPFDVLSTPQRSYPLARVLRVVGAASRSAAEDAQRDLASAPDQARDRSLPGEHSVPIVFVSADFRSSHPIGREMCSVLPSLERSRGMRVRCALINPLVAHDAVQSCLARACGPLIPLHGKSDRSAAKALLSATGATGLLVDLMGHTLGARASVIARVGLAGVPVVSYKGFEGFMAHRAVWQLRITDRVTTPPEIAQRAFAHGAEASMYKMTPFTLRPPTPESTTYVEQLTSQPRHAQLMADLLGVAPRQRRGCARPCVLGSFGQAYKIDEKTVRMWVNVLRQRPCCLLWLQDSPRGSAAMLRRRIARLDRHVWHRVRAVAELPAASHLAVKAALATAALDTAGTFSMHGTAAELAALGLPIVSWPIRDRPAARLGAAIALASGQRCVAVEPSLRGALGAVDCAIAASALDAASRIGAYAVLLRDVGPSAWGEEVAGLVRMREDLRRSAGGTSYHIVLAPHRRER